MQQAEEPAAEAEAQRGAALHLEAERRVVEAQAGDAFAQLLEVGGVDREHAAEHHRLHFLVAGQRLGRPALHRGDRVADAGLLHFLDLRGDEADLARREFGQVDALGGEGADAVDQVFGLAGHELDLQALFQDPVDHPHQDHHAEVGIVPAVDQHRLQGRGAVAGGGRDLLDDRLERFLDADARLGAGEHGFGCVDADDVLDLVAHLLGLGGGEVDLVDDGDDLVVVLDRLVHVGERLRLDPLRRVDHQQRTLARGQGAADLVREVDVTGRIHQVELIREPVLGGVVQPHRLGLDRDPPLTLNVHVIKHLLAHLARSQAPRRLDQPIRQGRFPMVDMGDN